MGLDQDVHEQVSAALGDDFVVDAVRVTPAGKRRVARVIVERPVEELVGDTPIEPLTLDEIADATRLVSEALDASDVLGSQPYTLEVSTPGTDRPLIEPAHFRRVVGRVVAITRAGSDEASGGQVIGRVTTVTADGVELHVKGTKQRPPHTEHIPFAEITKGVTQVEFSRPKSTSADADDES